MRRASSQANARRPPRPPATGTGGTQRSSHYLSSTVASRSGARRQRSSEPLDRSASAFHSASQRCAAPPLSLEKMNSTLQRLHARLERGIADCRTEMQNGGELLQRATRLNERLDILKCKLRMCFQMSGVEEPEYLQVVLQQMASIDPEDAPPEYLCPITQCIMVDPVRTSDGHAYDRCAIVEWFANFTHGQPPTSPLTNLPLVSTALASDRALRQRIQEFLHDAAAKGNSSGAADPCEPSLREVPPGVLNQPTLPQSGGGGTRGAKDNGGSGPIWSSSVVPLSEENSRVLNIIRTDELIPIPTVPSNHALLASSATLPSLPRLSSSKRGVPPSLRAPLLAPRTMSHLYDASSSLAAGRPSELAVSAAPVPLRNPFQRGGRSVSAAPPITRSIHQPINLNRRQSQRRTA